MEWTPIDPNVLARFGMLYRCSVCGSLVCDIDRAKHEHHHEHELAA